MKGPKQLLEHEDHWVTSMGAWFPGERVVFRDKDLFDELNDISWMGLLLYGITERFFDENQLKLFEGIWVLCTSYPDPRLWNNRVAALAGTSRSTGELAISAANAVSGASIYGHRPIIRAIDFLFRAKELLQQGANLTELVRVELKKYRGIAGFGRPLVRGDERIQPLMSLAEKLGLANGKYVQLAFAIEEILSQGRWRLQMNIAALAAALGADQGLSRREYSQYLTLCFSAGIVACYIDAVGKSEGIFFPIRCQKIRYFGTRRRTWAS